MSGAPKLDPRIAAETADEIDAYDQMIADGQSGKRDTFGNIREQLEGAGLDKDAVKAELAGLKRAIRLRQLRRSAPAKLDAEDEREALAGEYLALIDGASRAPRTTRTHVAPPVPDHDPYTGEIIPSATQTADPTGAEAEPRVAEPVATSTETPPSIIFPEGQDEGQPVEGRDGSEARAVEDKGAHTAAHSGQFVATSGAGEGVAASADPAPASKGFAPKKGDPFLNPDKPVGKIIRDQLCSDYGLNLAEFDDFRAAMIAGKPADTAAYIARTGG